MYKSLEFSEDGLYNRDLFLGNFNEVNFYFEDNKKEYLYEAFLSKLFNYKVFSVFCLNGKPSVKNKFDELKIKDINNFNKSVFIVDDDFDILLKKDIYNYSNFIYIGKYNFEACLFEKNNINFIIKYMFRCTENEVCKFFDYDSWSKKFLLQIKPFIILYAAIIKSECGLSIFENSIISKNGDILLSKYIDFYNAFSSKCSNCNEYIKEISKIIQKDFHGCIDDFICGKFLFRIFLSKTEKKRLAGFGKDELIFYILGERTNNYIFEELKNKICAFINNNCKKNNLV